MNLTPNKSGSDTRVESADKQLQNVAGKNNVRTLQQRLWHSLRRGIAMDGLHYHHHSLALEISFGNPAPHSCGYRLLCADEDLGEIVFMRTRRFTEQELQIIEALIPTLVNPLRHSLRSHYSEDNA